MTQHAWYHPSSWFLIDKPVGGGTRKCFDMSFAREISESYRGTAGDGNSRSSLEKCTIYSLGKKKKKQSVVMKGVR